MSSVGAAAGAIRAGKAFVEFFADDAALVSSLRKTHAVLNGFGRDLVRMGLWMKVTGAAMTAPFIVSAKIFTETGDRLDAMSRRTGLAVESLSGLELATQLTDFSMGAMENALKRMQRTLVQLAFGTSQASRALGLLNLAAGDILHLTPEEQLGLIADRLMSISDATLRAGAAMAIFGREATGILPMLEGGAEGLKDYIRRSKELGLVISQDVIKSADHLNDIYEILKLQVNRLAVAIGGGLEPILTPLAERFTRIVAEVIKWTKKNGELIRILAKIAVATFVLGGAIFTLGISILLMGKALGGFLSLFTLFKVLIASVIWSVKVLAMLLATALANPLLGAVVLLAAMSFALLVWSGDVSRAIAFVGARFKNLGHVVGGTLEGIADALLSGDITAATNILLLGMRLAWKVGIGAIQEIWTNFSTFLIKNGVDVLDWIQAAWQETVKFLSDVFFTFLANTSNMLDAWAFMFKTTWVGIGAFVKKVSDRIAVLAVPKERRDEVLAQLNQETLDIQVTKDAEAAAVFLGELEKTASDLALDLAAVATSYEDAMAKIGDANLKTNEMLDAELKDELANLRAQETVARDAWRAARREAFGKRLELEGKTPGWVSNIKKIITQMQNGLMKSSVAEVAGTFTSVLLLGRGGGSVAERTANATEESARLLDIISGDIDNLSSSNFSP